MAAVKALGEIAFRTESIDEMADFYENVVGLSVLERGDTAVFFSLGESYGGHTQVFVLFDRTATDEYEGIDQRFTTVDHVAFTIDLSDFDSEVARLEDAGLDVRTTTHAWVQWRSLYFADPDGNSVEFVCHDETITG
ncbi:MULTISPECIES: VOC family protein [unclassified Haladaptatus]|uniref:VOC family protein n=1 Tax=unclassified Haladaptatus TaxID=2622732 RepID=UPI0023E7AD22|nr:MULTISPECIES: VOC family protein [unclassified Haladaptatus]